MTNEIPDPGLTLRHGVGLGRAGRERRIDTCCSGRSP